MNNEGSNQKGFKEGEGFKNQKNVGNIGGAQKWESGNLMNIPKGYKGGKKKFPEGFILWDVGLRGIYTM
ncbi:hypothetical protein BGAL_0167g00170 [Botrytis galanthina]|uniref:Uncharacterized protein n=1 Tax=Botrytis galanthina TaxID=278940 RepID=A0A4S8R9R3_9HELO|nr:hypothetical protein BGAL_0167g00170 [Botrytis galanthina]